MAVELDGGDGQQLTCPGFKIIMGICGSGSPECAGSTSRIWCAGKYVQHVNIVYTNIFFHLKVVFKNMVDNNFVLFVKRYEYIIVKCQFGEVRRKFFMNSFYYVFNIVIKMPVSTQ